MWEFKEELIDPNISGKVPKQFKNEDGDYDCKKAIIEWTLDFEMRDYGVKDVYITIKKVTLVFSDWDYGSKSYIIDDESDFEFDWGWYNREDMKWLTIFPTDIFIDLDDEKVRVEF